MADAAAPPEEQELQQLPIEPDQIILRSEAQREIDVRLVPWGVEIDTMQGLEEFERGAFDGVAPEDVELMGLEHQVTFGLDQAGNVKPVREEVGYATALDNRADGQYATFRIYPTPSGDEVYQRIVAGRRRRASMEFKIAPGGARHVRTANGRNKAIITRALLPGVSIVRRGAYATSEVVAVRTDKEDAPVAEDTAAVEATTTPEPAPAPVQAAASAELQLRSFSDMFDSFGHQLTSVTEGLSERLGKIEERQRSDFVVPAAGPAAPAVHAGDWMQYALRALSGERVSREDMAFRAVADVITSDNLGVVPDAFLQGELIGAINSARPFMSSTRRLPTPRGMTLHVPKIEQRPLVELQSEEKEELASQAIKVTTADFNAKTKGGVIDISLQLLKQSEPPFLELANRLMFEAYAQETEKEALEELTGDTDFNDAGTIDPEAPLLGEAWLAAFTETSQAPDTIWLSPAAVGAFIDAVASGSGLPRFPNITAANGGGGTISGLQVVVCPQLANVGVDVIVGPSSGFAWAESGSYNLQVDVPSRAGRDVAIVGIVWFAPYYPAAFSGYTLS